MNRWQASCGVLMFVAAAVISSTGWSDDKEKGTDKPAAKGAKEGSGKAAAKAPAKGAKPRLPRYYGKLGLSDAQRDKIYGIQSKYETDIDKLEKQLAEMKGKLDADCRKVLNADQKKQLTETIEAAKAKAAKEEEMEE